MKRGHGSPEKCRELQGSWGEIQHQLALEVVLWQSSNTRRESGPWKEANTDKARGGEGGGEGRPWEPGAVRTTHG